MESNIANTCFSLVSIAGILCLLFNQYKNYRIDAFRQDIFEIRDELFEYAKNGNIGFRHPAYGALRSLMNGFIRFGHQISILRLLITIIILKHDLEKDSVSFSAKWANSTKDLKPNVKLDMCLILQKVHFSVFKHLVLNSPEIVITVFPPLILYALSKHYIGRLNKLMHKPNDEIDCVAYAYGNI